MWYREGNQIKMQNISIYTSVITLNVMDQVLHLKDDYIVFKYKLVAINMVKKDTKWLKVKKDLT